MDVIRGFETKPPYNQKCTGCGTVIGPLSDIKGGFRVVDGEVTGLFHSRACYNDQVEKFIEYKKNKGGVE